VVVVIKNDDYGGHSSSDTTDCKLPAIEDPKSRENRQKSLSSGSTYMDYFKSCYTTASTPIWFVGDLIYLQELVFKESRVALRSNAGTVCIPGPNLHKAQSKDKVFAIAVKNRFGFEIGCTMFI
jgi:hypothetical protein